MAKEKKENKEKKGVYISKKGLSKKEWSKIEQAMETLKKAKKQDAKKQKK